ncbi:dihydroorotate dehydrogenase (quinone) [Leucobacter sp. OLJS4]|uniref:quinone-dependent dihydroorotate dehydrogenase n=1 Tax=unclassified Leucobacter TaxID=2621730 RepID=UPI000C1A872A|nr:dihydroorotate dehydrogenase (quinone) [Leucobacter sp. OLCALW19]PII86500.1 dihydroorotate dehydrogenase (quinone) [Leucobacter sp. OLTLW20]PII90436.1 dihydroorotate dehydrogenase (quinone) [Leucobacter sp. OLAS13]PII97469.1 dihydroorotate dehydrogenase (quinone) [Leucobacter sp. OLDS2]PIJ02515.1 dihydroorotate dehydrogenase (quinone) [Leucobacter sp. OLIS6]PIJ04637.1 dihydroorotate dehydrogenase (quinone) [Leucobacter sp. OLCS4]PIJ13770.1 dihydroorotate dehydrogenase (quinone) [Leucobacte
MYPQLFNTLLRRMDPEQAHHLAFGVIKGAPAAGAALRALCAPDPSLRVRALGLDFPSPFGLAAGFDKNAEGILGLGAFGFGHVEVGTLTRHAQPGNPKPRMHRLVDDRGLINRMGFNNGGSAAAVARIERARLSRHRPIIGVNIGKSRVTEVDDAVQDYVWSAQRLAPVADYLAVNVSSPNTPGLRGLQELSMLRPLLAEVRDAAQGTPLLVKIAPDLDDPQIDGIVDLVGELGLDGIIATNTTISREGLTAPASEVEAMGAGGLSGAPLKQRSLEVLHRIREAAPPELCVVSVGGVTTAADVRERLDAGATLVQGFTAYIYEGPFWARDINRGLAASGWRQNS